MQNEGHLHAYWDSRCKLVRVQTGFFKLASSGSGFVIDRSSLVAWMWSWLFQCNTSFCVLICVLSLWNIQYLYLPTEKKQQTGYGSGRFSQGLLRLLIPHLQLTSALLKCYVCKIVSKLWEGLCVYYVRMITYVCTLSTCFYMCELVPRFLSSSLWLPCLHILSFRWPSEVTHLKAAFCGHQLNPDWFTISAHKLTQKVNPPWKRTRCTRTNIWCLVKYNQSI